MTANANRTAFPQNATTESFRDRLGLTKREYFAALALQGYIAAGSMGMPEPPRIVELAVQTADALLAALEATP